MANVMQQRCCFNDLGICASHCGDTNGEITNSERV
jgi:hypothetical protein